MPIETRKNYKGELIIVNVEDGKETLIANPEKPVQDAYKDLKNKLWLAKSRADEVPKALSFLPVIINYIDDAQDLLITGLNIVKPVAKYLPGVAGKGIGWALKANDKMNAATEVLAKAVNPFCKIHNLWKGQNPGSKATKTDIGRMNDWLKQKGWQSKLGAFLQGAQATDTIWGKGLQLGAVMGAYNEATWASMDMLYSFVNPKYSKDFQTRIEGINKEYQEAVQKGQELVDAVGKAVDKLWTDWVGLWGVKRSTIEETSLRVLMQFNQLPALIDFLDDDQVISIITATRTAMSVLSSQKNVVMDHRVERFMQLPYPRPYPVKQTSISMLKSLGLEYKDCLPAIDTDHGWPTISEAMDDGIRNHDLLEEKLRSRADQDPEKWSPVYQLWSEAGREFINTVAPFNEEEYTQYNDLYFIATSCDKHDFTLNEGYTQKDLENLLQSVAQIAKDKGYKLPTEKDWILSANINNIAWDTKTNIKLKTTKRQF